MRCFVAMCVFREGASEVGPDMPAAQKRREELWKASPAGPIFLALLWLTRTTGSLRFWQSNSHGKRFTTAAYRGDTVHSKVGTLLLLRTVVGRRRQVRHHSCQLGIIHQHPHGPNDGWR